VQARPLSADRAQALLLSLLSFRRTKYVVLVDEDVDIMSETAVMEAIATRTQPGRDFVLIEDAEGSRLDPSVGLGSGRSAKLGIDATWNGGRKPPKNTVPRAASDSPAVRAALARIAAENGSATPTPQKSR
jgi:2,5-furandicarboxylate decarboxylase 1